MASQEADNISSLSRGEIRSAIQLLEARLSTLKIIEAMGKRPIAVELLECRLAIEALKKEAIARG